MTTWTGRTSPTTTWNGRTPIVSVGGYLLINAVDRLLINATDKLIISTGGSGTVWTGRIIP